MKIKFTKCITLTLMFLFTLSANNFSATNFQKSSLDVGQGAHWYYEDINGSIGYQESSCNDPAVYTRSFQGGTIDMYCGISTNTIVTEFAMSSGPNIPYQASVWTGGNSSGSGGSFSYGNEVTVGNSIAASSHKGGYNDHGVRGN